MRIATTFAEIDNICDYIPFVSTASNLVDLFEKCVCKYLSKEAVGKNRYWSHINWKDVSRSLILLVPIIGNIYVAFCDYNDYQESKVLCENSQRSGADMLAMMVNQTGLNVSSYQMMPAPTENEQIFWAACCNKDGAQTIRDLLRKGISPNFYHAGHTPLVTACRYSTAEVVQLLVEAGADVNTWDRLGTSPFAAACQNGDLELVGYLSSQFLVLDVNTPNFNGQTPLMYAAGSGSQAVVEFLIRAGADLRKRDAQNNGDAATNAISVHDHAHLLPFLFSVHENVDDRRYKIQISQSFFTSTTIKNLTPLLYATLVGAEKSALYLVEKSDVQCVDSTGSNALHYANSHKPVLQALLNKSQDAAFVNKQNIAGSTPLHKTLQLNRPNEALLLLQYGADPFLANNNGQIPLILAVEKGFGDVVEYIRQHHAVRITAAIELQIADIQRQQRTGAEPVQQEEKENNLLLSSLKSMQSMMETKANQAQKIEEIGPMPRSAMEMIFGRILWPV